MIIYLIFKLLYMIDFIIIIILIIALILFTLLFDFRIRVNKKEQKIRTKHNTLEHDTLTSAIKTLITKFDILLESNIQMKDKLHETQFIFQVEIVNNTKLREKLIQACDSINFNNNKEKDNAKFIGIVNELIVIIADTYKKLRLNGANRIVYEQIEDINNSVKNILLKHDFSILNVSKLITISERILGDFNSEKKSKDNSVLIAKKFRVFLKELYHIFITMNNNLIDEESMRNIVKYISSNKIPNVFLELNKLDIDNYNSNQLTLLESQFNSINDLIITNQINKGQENLMINNLKKQILSFLDLL